MQTLRLDPRSTQELLADAERFERWAARTDWNPEISGKFRRMAEDSRSKAGGAAR